MAWTEEETEIVNRFYLEKDDGELAEMLNKTQSQIKYKRLRLGLNLPKEVLEERRKKVGLKRPKGENCPNWKGGSYRHTITQRKRYPEKAKARWAVANALREGRLKREPCQECGEIKSEAHHEDYTKPLEVDWLCKKCHTIRHKKKV
jgi:ribosomal protein S27AE